MNFKFQLLLVIATVLLHTLQKEVHAGPQGSEGGSFGGDTIGEGGGHFGGDTNGGDGGHFGGDTTETGEEGGAFGGEDGSGDSSGVTYTAVKTNIFLVLLAMIAN